jgi:hypothetical protein
MPDAIRCFWLEPTDEWELSLRRYVTSHDTARQCATSGIGYHNAEAAIGRGVAAAAPKLIDGQPLSGDVFPHDDPRWPARCACGYEFRAGDAWQFNARPLYRRRDTSELVTLGGAPVGAMWDAHWMGEEYRGPDGIALCIKTPGGDWLVDGPAYADGQVKAERGWSRSGALPEVTASPSIEIPSRYHGWLRAGVLVAC